MRFLLLFALLGLKAVCVFGLLATLEPMDSESQLTWRLVYSSGLILSWIFLVRVILGLRDAAKES